jgi:hypothetical protein
MLILAPKKLFSVVFLSFLISQSYAQCASHKRHVAEVTEDTYVTQEGHPILLQVGPGFVSGVFSEGISLNAGAVVKVSNDTPIYAGVDTMLTLGTNYSYLDFGYYDSFYGGSSIGLGILGTAYYNFTFPRRPMLHIIGGLSGGPFIGGGHISIALLARPGFTYDFNHSISITGEPLFGIIGSGFVVMPRALLSFKM